MNISPNEHQSNHELRYPEDMYRRAGVLDKAVESAVEVLSNVIDVADVRVRSVGSSAVETVSNVTAGQLHTGELTPEQARERVKFFLENPQVINAAVTIDEQGSEPAIQQSNQELEALEAARNLARNADTLKTELPESNPLFDQAA